MKKTGDYLVKEFLKLIAEQSPKHDRSQGPSFSRDVIGIADGSQQNCHLLLKGQIFIGFLKEKRILYFFNILTHKDNVENQLDMEE